MSIRVQALFCSVAVLVSALVDQGNSLFIEKRQAAIACADIPAPILPGAQILSVHGAERHNVSGQFSSMGMGLTLNQTGLNFCDVNVTYTHPGVNDTITARYWLPLKAWNGRYQSTGGGGLSAGGTTQNMGSALAAGFSAGTTDGGHLSNDGVLPSPQALPSPGHIDFGLITDFSGRGYTK
ncbi:hypothetical protein CLAIMM_04097 [Cladophialophora immunda]|nr:hypothetical protein CLAIMM_04097 [Cladophialophora immunda]